MPIEIPSIVADLEPAESLYVELLSFLDTLGAYRVEEKTTNVQVVSGRGPFLAIYPKKHLLRLNTILDRAMEGKRIVKTEQVSAKTFNNEVDFKDSGQLDKELKAWLKEAHDRVNS